jgi:DNA modification methylase
MTWQVLEADCVEAMAAMPAASVDAVVCDPPYGLGFMGKEWDTIGDTGRGARARSERAAEVTPNGEGHSTSAGPYLAAGVDSLRSAGAPYQRWCEAWAREALRVLKPGGHLLAFGGTRTYHRLACAVEDAGFEVRDCLAWLYGSGFPKSLDVSKAIDKAAGAEREVVGDKLDRPGYHLSEPGKADGVLGNGHGLHVDPEARARAAEITAPATPDAEQWQGWGTALKPAHEPIVLARKPLAGTVAGNVLAHGTGALNVDGCRIGSEERPVMVRTDTIVGANAMSGESTGATGNGEMTNAGRWPANVVMDEQAAAKLDAQTGTLTSGDGTVRRDSGSDRNGNQGAAYGAESRPSGTPMVTYGDSGGASRFLYVAKASSAERNAGLDGFEAVERGSNFGMDGARPHTAPDYTYQAKGARNTHPTVKPIELMRWLVRLVTPPGGVALDPFTGSGTTGIACMLEGLRFVGIEREPEYAAIARARIAWWMAHPEGVEIVKALEADRERRKVADSGQLGLL